MTEIDPEVAARIDRAFPKDATWVQPWPLPNIADPSVGAAIDGAGFPGPKD